MRKLLIALMVMMALLAGIVTAFFFTPGMIGDLITNSYPASSTQRPDDDEGWNLFKYWPDNINLQLSPSGPSSSVQDLAEAITAGIDDDYAKMVAIYDWVTNNITYDLDKAKDISAYGSGADYLLETGSGVCHDYAQLTRELLLSVGIEATYETGEVINSSGETELHAWNQALIGGRWYALDTTWGAGFIFDEDAVFIQKPRRLYLTSPAELDLLHRDPDYKQEQEQEYMSLMAVNAPLLELPEYEKRINQFFNSYRFEKDLPLLSEEMRLNEMARNYARIIAEEVSGGDDFTLQHLSEDISGRAAELNIKSAAMHVMVKWFAHPAIIDQIFEKIIEEQAAELDQVKWEGLASGAVSKGDLLIFVFILIDYY